jgi:flagellar L-ring protein precursor FlgH
MVKYNKKLERKKEKFLIFGVFISLLISSCAAKKEPEFPKVQDVEEPAEQPIPQEGSLFYDGSPFSNIYSDLKAKRVGDVVIVRIVETVKARNDQRKDMSRNSSINYGMGASLSEKGKIKDGISLGAQAEGKNSFSSKGVQNSENLFIATVGARVIKVLPSGNLLIEGEKYIRHDSELQKIYVKGIVRPEDIMHDNSVLSTSLVNARIEYVSEGDFAQKKKQGWLQKILDFISPF